MDTKINFANIGGALRGGTPLGGWRKSRRLCRQGGVPPTGKIDFRDEHTKPELLGKILLVISNINLLFSASLYMIKPTPIFLTEVCL